MSGEPEKGWRGGEYGILVFQRFIPGIFFFFFFPRPCLVPLHFNLGDSFPSHKHKTKYVVHLPPLKQ